MNTKIVERRHTDDLHASGLKVISVTPLCDFGVHIGSSFDIY